MLPSNTIDPFLKTRARLQNFVSKSLECEAKKRVPDFEINSEQPLIASHSCPSISIFIKSTLILGNKNFLIVSAYFLIMLIILYQ